MSKTLQHLKSLAQSTGAVMVNAEDLRQLLAELDTVKAENHRLADDLDQLEYMSEPCNEYMYDEGDWWT